MPSQRDDDNNKKTVAAEVSGESDKVAGSIVGEEDLRTDGVTGCPDDKVGGDRDGLLGLSGDVS